MVAHFEEFFPMLGWKLDRKGEQLNNWSMTTLRVFLGDINGYFNSFYGLRICSLEKIILKFLQF